jgi:hypothetical protein
MRRWLAAGALAGLILGSVVAAQAVTVLKFDDPLTPGGTVSSGGIGSTINGTDILFQSIQRLDDGIPVGPTLTCVGCELNFATNLVNSVTNPTPTSVLLQALVGGSGIYEVTTAGGVFNGAIQVVPAGSTLLIGTFAGAQPTVAINLDTDFTLFLGGGPDTKHPALLSFFGLDGGFTFGATEVGLTTGIVDPITGSFTSSVVNSDLNNILTTPTQVPAPLGLVLIGLGLVGLAASRRLLAR